MIDIDKRINFYSTDLSEINFSDLLMALILIYRWPKLNKKIGAAYVVYKENNEEIHSCTFRFQIIQLSS